MKYLFITAFLFSAILTFSQMHEDIATAIIKGKIVDSKGKQPLSYATVAIYKTDSTLIDGGITDDNGNFSFNIKPGDYYIEVQFVAYNKQVIPNITVTDRKSSIDLGTILLEPSSISLNEVVVQGEKSEMVIGIDRKIFNVGKDLSNTGNSAAEILDNIPTVAVDADGNVTLRGSSGVRILIDGKPSGLVNSGNADALRALQGNIIERVEVITNPSSRYEAEGMTGIINIILKKDQRNGVNGSVEITTGYPESYSASANINFRRKVVNYFFNYGARYQEREGNGYSNQIFPLVTPAYKTLIDRERNRSGWSHNLRGGADFYLNKTTTLSAAAMVSFDNESNNSNVRYRDFYLDETNPYNESVRLENEKGSEQNMEFSINMEKQFDSDKHKLNFFAQYLKDTEDEDSELEESIITGVGFNDPPLLQTVMNEENEENFMFQGDYIVPFGKEGSLETGLRGEMRKIKNPYNVQELQDDIWIELDEYTNDFRYNENVLAGYVQGANKFGKIGLQMGLRVEYSDINTELKQGEVKNSKNYFDFFPTVHTSFHFNSLNAWQISYSRRINRPNFRNLNPFMGYSDSRNIRSGNPDLDPEYTNAFESGYVYTPGTTSVYLGIYYRHTNGAVETINYVDSDGITYTAPRNLAKRYAYGAETNISKNIFKWWNVSGNVNFYRMQTEGVFVYNNSTTDLSSDTYSWDTRINSRMNFPKSLSFQSTFFYRGKQETTQGLLKPFVMMNASVSKEILKNKGTITLNVRDVLDSRKFRYTIDQPDLMSENEFRWSGRQILFSFIYRINQNKKSDRKSNNNEDGDFNDAGF